MPDVCVSSRYKGTSSVNISVSFFYEIIKTSPSTDLKIFNGLRFFLIVALPLL